MLHAQRKYRHHVVWSIILLIFLVLLAGCGGGNSAASSAMPLAAHSSAGNSTTNGASAASNTSNSSSTNNGSATQKMAAAGQNKDSTALAGPQYLIKTLKVDMQVKDTGQVANDLQAWIGSTDAASTSAGTNYQQAGDNLYNISMTFDVRASFYPQIYRYLRDYPGPKGGKLVAFNEAVQDVTNDYVDTQSRLRNLKAEQSRLLDLMSHAQAMGDILNIEQRLSDIEGQIESIEAHINELNSQVTFYNVTITLEPLDTAVPPPPAPGWSVGPVFHDAFSASLALAQQVISFLIWLFAFSFYIIPLAIAAWLWRKWHSRVHIGQPPIPQQ